MESKAELEEIDNILMLAMSILLHFFNYSVVWFYDADSIVSENLPLYVACKLTL